MANYHQLIRNDWKMIWSDPMLMLSLLAPLLYLGIIVFGVPYIEKVVGQLYDISPEYYVPFVKFFFLPICPMLFGMIYGFILLDERDGGLISYLSVTPLGKSGYLIVRMLMPVLYSFIFNVAFFYISGLNAYVGTTALYVLSFIIAWESPLMLLLLSAFADNKVEGVAISKGFGILLIMLIPDYFFDSGWLWVLSVSPLWWIERGIFHSDYQWWYIAGAALVHLIYFLILYRKFSNKV
jgi:fluoroquinolone transport system permease protein